MKRNFLVCGHDLRFIQPFINYIGSSTRYNLRLHHHSGHLINNEEQATCDLEWADIILCEWALGNALWFSQRKKSHQRLIVRLHSQEIEARDTTLFIWMINWSNVDRLILISDHLYYWIQKNCPQAGAKATLVYNPIPSKQLKLTGFNRHQDKVIGLVGIVPARKRFDLAIKLLWMLLKDDNNWILKIKGSKPSKYPWMHNKKKEMEWFNNIFKSSDDLINSSNLVYDEYSDNMADYYASVGYILSVSDFEGSHQAIAEGMASGCIPVIRDWTGAHMLYPRQYVHSNLEEMHSFILSTANSETTSLIRTEVINYATLNFDQDIICPKIEEISNREINNRLINIGIIAYIPLGSKSGYRIRVEQEIQSLALLGHTVSLVCILPGKESGPSYDYDRARQEQELSAYGCKVFLVYIDDFFSLDINRAAPSDKIGQVINIIQNEVIQYLHCEALYCARIGIALKRQLPHITFGIDWHGAVPEESAMGGAHTNRVRVLEETEVEALLTVPCQSG